MKNERQAGTAADSSTTVEATPSASLAQNPVLAEAFSVRPILFSTPMVQAIMNGQKTQTRRIVKGTALEWLQPDMFTPEFVANPENSMCPYGKVGDMLWVRETFMPLTTGYAYRADGLLNEKHPFTKWKPSIFMPKDACRFFLEITNLRIERIKDINENDAHAEGIIMTNKPHEGWYWMENVYSTDCPIFAYHKLWEKINGQDSLVNNDWVWVVTFKIAECPQGFC